ncbi:MAG: DPP IV N-terminal domain-containing protein [Chitinophagaceae bacterium]|nr:DPP IV N-terminal domain-containing protein [Chitinophagaceae bacterium]
MKQLLVSAFSFLLILSGYSQPYITSCDNSKTRQLTMDEAMLKARTTLAPANLAQLQFYGTTNDYVYLKDGVWMRGNNKTSADTAFLSLEQLNSQLSAASLSAVKTMPPIRFRPDGWLLTHNGNKLLLDPVTRRFKKLLTKELADKENAEESKAGFVAYLDNHNLYVTHISNPDDHGYLSNDKPVQVTKDGSKDIVYASSVHRDEFGISKGTFWSNEGSRLAFYRMDQSMVTDYPIIDWTAQPARADLIKYPMAGDKSHHVTVGVFDAVTSKTTWLQTGLPAEQYLTNIAWSPDDKFIFIAVVNREQNHMWLNQYDVASGAFVKTLFEQTDDKYTEPLVPMQFLKNNPAQFLWQSNRDGWNHLYLYDINGQLVKQVTTGKWEVLDVKGFDAKGENLFFTSTIISPVDKTLCMVNMKTGIVTIINNVPGVHTTQLSADGSAVLDVFSTVSNPRTVQLITIGSSGKSKKTMKPAMTAKTLLQATNPLSDYTGVQLSVFTIKNKNGDSLFCRVYKPCNGVSDMQYPVIVYWYGGPHAQMILNNWNGGAGDYWFRYMAQRGYAVFTLDTRGSDNRGKAFEQSIHRMHGKAQMEDLESAIEYLGAQPWADTKRMGLFGWSYGGFMTTDFVLNHPGVFKAAVAGGPVMDWKYYEIMYGERYMDTPQENPDGYTATNLLKQAAKLKDKLLLIHGLQDPVVVQQHSVMFVKACVDAGVQVDYMIYPGHEHNVGGKDRAHLYQKVTDYFNQHVK